MALQEQEEYEHTWANWAFFRGDVKIKKNINLKLLI